jgi:putative heme-binding domain-containing protein
VKIAGEPIDRLLDLLKEPEDRVRYRVKIELGARKTDEVMDALERWVAALDRNDIDYEHNLLEALWVHQFHDVVDVGLLRRLLEARDFRARAAATRVLCYWRDRVPGALDLLKKLAADPYPRVRLEAVRAASFFTVPEAMEVALITAEHPSDYYLDYTRNETMRALQPHVKKALDAGRSIEFTSAAGARFFLRKVDTDSLLKMKRTRGVLQEILFRKGLREEVRQQALADLARLAGEPESKVLVDALRGRDTREDDPGEGVVIELARLLTDRGARDLAPARDEIARLASEASLPAIRQLGYASLIAADGSADRAWLLAARSVGSLRDLLGAMPLIRDPALRAGLYPRIEPLLRGLPTSLASAHPGKGSTGRYVRIELPRRGTLTLAEVEVYSDGRNVARQGKATQKNTASGGVAARGIDGNTSGRYSDLGQTHTQEMTDNPWWEVDLGAEFPIDSVVIYNRTDGQLGRRLVNFTLTVLDAGRNVGARKEGVKAPEGKLALDLGGDGPEGVIRRAAMNALTYARGQETPTFRALAKFVRDGVDRHAAVLALQKIPVAYWPAEEAGPLLESLIAYVRQVPVADRTSPAALDALQLGDSLAALLPADRARAARKELSGLGVRVIRIGTVLEQMRYDLDRIVVQAGKPVEIVFENTDMMPHNLVVARPGALEEVGLLAEATATRPDAARRQYIPESPRILFFSRLLQPREAQKLSFTAPSQAGVYPYVCTYPGHWRRMYGALYVVDDLDGYLASPESYLAGHPVTIADEMLKSTRPRTEWTFDDLAAPLAQLGTDRSFGNGKQLFQVATCASCHRMGGLGNEFGPDLTKLEPKQTPADLLRNILEPSSKINEKYNSYLFELESGQVITGLIVGESADLVKVVENPLASTEPKVLKKSEIAGRKKSPTSLMPKGLLDKLTREEILDLIAYIAACGDPEHALFKGDHAKGHGHGGGH